MNKIENKPILTIAIPTYNRGDSLKLTSSLILKYCDKYKNSEIEVLISDNASTDNTKDVVKEIQNSYPYVEYYCNNKNLGFDGNFLNCFNRANGKYIWILSDDDVPIEGCVESIMKGLEKEPVCMHLNTSSLLDEKEFRYSKPRLKGNGYFITNDRNELLKKIGIFCTFVSSNVYRVDYVKEIKNKEEYFNTNILQSHILLEIMKNEGKYMIDYFNCLAARGNRTVGYDVYRTWVKNYGDLILKTGKKSNFNNDTLNDVLHNSYDKNVYEFIINLRSTCANSDNWDDKCVWEYINRYQGLVKKYKEAIYCKKSKLRFLQLKNKFKNKLNRIVYGK